MPDPFLFKKTPVWNRRQLLKLGLVGIGVTGAAFAVQKFAQKHHSSGTVKVPPLPNDASLSESQGMTPMAVLRDFDYGTVKKENGRTIENFGLLLEPARFNSIALYRSSLGILIVAYRGQRYVQKRAIASE